MRENIVGTSCEWVIRCFLDEVQIFLFVEALHHDERPAEPNRSSGADKRRGMIQRRRHEIGHALPETPVLHVAWENRVRLRRRKIIERPLHALGMARRPGGIEHGCAKRLIQDRRSGIG
jgi:hypothetical protein